MGFYETISVKDRLYTVRPLASSDEGTLQQLCMNCPDYFRIVEDRQPPEDAPREILFERPPGKDTEDKFVEGVFDEKGLLVAVIDLVRDFPELGIWITGLLMIDPSQRGLGLGRKLDNLIKSWAGKYGAHSIRIGVALDNQNALQFWSAMGYSEISRKEAHYGNKDNIIVVMTSPVEAK